MWAQRGGGTGERRGRGTAAREGRAGETKGPLPGDAPAGTRVTARREGSGGEPGEGTHRDTDPRGGEHPGDGRCHSAVGGRRGSGRTAGTASLPRALQSRSRRPAPPGAGAAVGGREPRSAPRERGIPRSSLRPPRVPSPCPRSTASPFIEHPPEQRRHPARGPHGPAVLLAPASSGPGARDGLRREAGPSRTGRSAPCGPAAPPLEGPWGSSRHRPPTAFHPLPSVPVEGLRVSAALGGWAPRSCAPVKSRAREIRLERLWRKELFEA